MLTHHTLECAKARLNPESHRLFNGSFLLTESFVKITSLWCTFVNPFLVVDPTYILVHPWVHRAHWLKSAALAYCLHQTTPTRVLKGMKGFNHDCRISI